MEVKVHILTFPFRETILLLDSSIFYKPYFISAILPYKFKANDTLLQTQQQTMERVLKHRQPENVCRVPSLGYVHATFLPYRLGD